MKNWRKPAEYWVSGTLSLKTFRNVIWTTVPPMQSSKDFLQHFSENIQTDNSLNSFSYELPVEVGGNKAVWIKTGLS